MLSIVWIAYKTLTTPWRWQPFAETCRRRIWNVFIKIHYFLEHLLVVLQRYERDELKNSILKTSPPRNCGNCIGSFCKADSRSVGQVVQHRRCIKLFGVTFSRFYAFSGNNINSKKDTFDHKWWSIFLCYYLLNYLLHAEILFEELTGSQLDKKFPAFFWNPNVHYRIPYL
jgi:hypothetical protein